MGSSVAHRLIASHLLDGEMTPGEEIALRIDQTLAQDATGTLVMLEFEALGLPEVRTELSAQYVDHNLLQEAGDVLRLDGLPESLERRDPLHVHDVERDRHFEVRHDLSARQVRLVLAGGLINEFRRRAG